MPNQRNSNFYGANMKKRYSLSAIAVFLGLISVGSANASPFSISMVGDNDFAIFSGTTTGINNLLYQNNEIWMSQIPHLSTLTFSLSAGDTMFYVLGMGGSGQENISGTVNGVDMTSVSVFMSSDIQSYLTGYDLSAVTSGAFNVSLADVQTAFSQLTWGAPVINTTDTVIQFSPNKTGFHFNDSTAHLFSFNASAVRVDGTVPEPTSLALLGLGLAGLVASRRRKQK